MSDDDWYCPACGEPSKEKKYLRHNRFVPIFVCPECIEKEQKHNENKDKGDEIT